MQAYLSHYPNGLYADLARNRIARLHHADAEERVAEQKAAADTAQKLAQQKAAAEAQRIAEQETAAEARRIAEQKGAEEAAQRLAEQKAATEAKKLAEQKRAEAAKQLAEQNAAAETQRLAEQKVVAETQKAAAQKVAREAAQRLAEQKAATEAKKLAEQKRAEAAKQLAEQNAAAETQRIAEQKAAAETRKAADQKAAEEAVRKLAEKKAIDYTVRPVEPPRTAGDVSVRPVGQSFAQQPAPETAKVLSLQNALVETPSARVGEKMAGAGLIDGSYVGWLTVINGSVPLCGSVRKMTATIKDDKLEYKLGQSGRKVALDKDGSFHDEYGSGSYNPGAGSSGSGGNPITTRASGRVLNSVLEADFNTGGLWGPVCSYHWSVSLGRSTAQPLGQLSAETTKKLDPQNNTSVQTPPVRVAEKIAGEGSFDGLYFGTVKTVIGSVPLCGPTREIAVTIKDGKMNYTSPQLASRNVVLDQNGYFHDQYNPFNQDSITVNGHVTNSALEADLNTKNYWHAGCAYHWSLIKQ